MDLLFHHTINLRGGVLLAPLGKFNVAHDSPIYNVVDRPLVSTRIIPATLSEAGMGLFGVFYPQGSHKLTYEIYDGIPLTERDQYGMGEFPDRIFIYRQGICAICESEDHVRDEVLITVVHEVAHHFGIDDDRLHELGWD